MLAVSGDSVLRHVRSARGRVYRYTEIADASRALSRAGNRSVCYLGWQGRQNVGDDAIFRAQQLGYGGQFVPYPVRYADQVVSVRNHVRRTPLPTDVLLGGGTVVGRPEWLERLDDHRSRLGDRRQNVFIWGAGVEDPKFTSAVSYATSDSLAAWVKRLKQSPAVVGVRGPRSQAILADHGLGSLVVGDPALRLWPRRGTRVVPEKVLLNLAAPEATYEAAEFSPVDDGRVLIEGLRSAGFEVEAFGMTPKDDLLLTELSRAVPSLRIHPSRRLGIGILDVLAGAGVVVSERLHGNVLAAAARRPFVSLDYRPKCADFAESVGMIDYNIALSRGALSEVVARTESAARWSDARSAAYLARVDELRATCLPSFAAWPTAHV